MSRQELQEIPGEALRKLEILRQDLPVPRPDHEAHRTERAGRFREFVLENWRLYLAPDRGRAGPRWEEADHLPGDLPRGERERLHPVEGHE